MRKEELDKHKELLAEAMGGSVETVFDAALNECLQDKPAVPFLFIANCVRGIRGEDTLSATIQRRMLKICQKSIEQIKSKPSCENLTLLLGALCLLEDDNRDFDKPLTGAFNLCAVEYSLTHQNGIPLTTRRLPQIQGEEMGEDTFFLDTALEGLRRAKEEIEAATIEGL